MHCSPNLRPLLALMCGLGLASVTGAADRVVVGPVDKTELDPWQAVLPTTYIGEIKQLDAREAIVATSDGQIVRISSARIEQVEVEWANDETHAAMQLVEERRYREAIKALEQCLREGVPRWQARFLVNGLIQSASGLGNPRIAGILFLNYLAGSEPPPLLYADMPLCWTSQAPDLLLKRQAEEWLSSGEEHAELLGASWLLFGEHAEQAQSQLTKLRGSRNPTIATLATVQAWRLVPPPQTMSRLAEWYALRETLLPPLQLGPTEFLADRLARTGHSDLAIGQWMRIVSQHRDRYHRVLPALQNAAKLLVREDETEAAQRLNEWIERLASS